MLEYTLNLKAVPFLRVKNGQRRAVFVNASGHQAGDRLKLYEVTEYGTRKTHFVERDERGRYLNAWVDGDPIIARITHVAYSSDDPSIPDGKVLLSLEVIS